MAYTFPGSGTVRVDYATLTPTTQSTWAYWATRTGTGGGSNGRSIQFSASYIHYYSTVAGTIRFVTDHPTPGAWYWTDGSSGPFHHLCITYDDASTANVPTVYVDGVSQSITPAQNPVGTPPHTAGAVTLGNDPSGVRSWAGSMGEVAYWTRILTAGEIAALAAGYSPLHIPRGLLFYSPLLREARALVGGGAGTVTGAPAVSAHPRTIYLPGSRKTYPPLAPSFTQTIVMDAIPVVTIQPDATAGVDAVANHALPTTNNGTSTGIALAGKSSTDPSYGHMKIDLSAYSPTRTVLDAALSMYTSSTGNADRDFECWLLDPSNQGWTETGLTWETRDGVTAWTGGANGGGVEGTDVTTLIGTAHYPANDFTDIEVRFPLTPSAVQPALGGTLYIVLKRVGVTTASGSPSFRSSDSSVVASRPKLTLTLSPAQANPPAVLPGAVNVGMQTIPAAGALYPPALGVGGVVVDLQTIPASGALSPPAVLPGAVAVDLPAIAPAGAVNPPAVAPQGVSVTLGTVAPGSALYSPRVAPQASTIVPPLLAGTTTLYPPGVSVGAATVTLTAIGAGGSVYPPALSRGAVVVNLGSIAPGTALYLPAVLTGSGAIFLGDIPPAEVVYPPAVSPGARVVVVGTVAPGTVLYGPVVLPPTNRVVVGTVPAAGALYGPALTTGGVAITMETIGGGTVVYVPAIHPTLYVRMMEIDSTIRLFAPALTVATMVVVLPDIGGASTVYAPRVIAGAGFIVMEALPAGTVLYLPTVRKATAGEVLGPLGGLLVTDGRMGGLLVVSGRQAGVLVDDGRRGGEVKP